MYHFASAVCSGPTDFVEPPGVRILLLAIELVEANAWKWHASEPCRRGSLNLGTANSSAPSNQIVSERRCDGVFTSRRQFIDHKAIAGERCHSRTVSPN